MRPRKNAQTDSIDGLLNDFDKSLKIVLKSLEGFLDVQGDTKDDSGKEGEPEKLLEFMLKLEPHVLKKKPKPSKEVLGEISGFDWPDEYKKGIADLKKFIGKYKFKDAHSVLESIIEKLKSNTS